MIEIFIGVISGIISGTGMGGGTILILCLSIFLGINQKVAQATNLIFFIPTSIAAIYVNVKEKNINFDTSKIVIFFGITGSVIGAIITKNIQVNLLKKIFGIFLAIIAIHEIYSIIKQYIIKKNTKNIVMKDKEYKRRNKKWNLQKGLLLEAW